MTDAPESSPGNTDAFARDVLDGLATRPRTIPSRWLYDTRGSQLFEQITGLEAYYPTRTERTIFETHAVEMANAVGPEAVVVEYGAGAAVKTRILLDALERPAAYVAIDVAGAFLHAATADLAETYPDLLVRPVVADFTTTAPLPDLPGGAGRRIGFFPGSTIGNLTDPEIIALLGTARDWLGPRAGFILGADLKKDPRLLVPAYDDPQGVTAAFNLNLLARINHELGADFDTSGFAHEARWNAPQSRIEMHLVSQRSQRVTVRGQGFDFEPGETIRTEISRKFDRATLADLAAKAGWHLSCTWQDARDYFCVAFLE